VSTEGEKRAALAEIERQRAELEKARAALLGSEVKVKKKKKIPDWLKDAMDKMGERKKRDKQRSHDEDVDDDSKLSKPMSSEPKPTSDDDADSATLAEKAKSKQYHPDDSDSDPASDYGDDGNSSKKKQKAKIATPKNLGLGGKPQFSDQESSDDQLGLGIYQMPSHTNLRKRAKLFTDTKRVRFELPKETWTKFKARTGWSRKKFEREFSTEGKILKKIAREKAVGAFYGDAEPEAEEGVYEVTTGEDNNHHIHVAHGILKRRKILGEQAAYKVVSGTTQRSRPVNYKKHLSQHSDHPNPNPNPNPNPKPKSKTPPPPAQKLDSKANNKRYVRGE